MGTIIKPLGSAGYTNVLDAIGTDVNSPNWKISVEGVTRYTKSISYSKDGVPITVGENWTITYGDKFTSLSTVAYAPKGEPTLVLGKKSVGIGTIPQINSEDLWLNPPKINNYEFIKYITLYTSQVMFQLVIT